MFASNTSAANGANYIEDVFSTYLYTGNGSTQTITNGIDLSGKGGLVWLKRRAGATQSHGWFDSQRTNGLSDFLSSDLTGTPTNDNGGTMVLKADGFTRSSASYFGGAGSGNGNTYASWTFRKQPKFFDIVTYTGNGANRTIAHNLGSVPGCMIIKRTDTTGAWCVYHRSLLATQLVVLSSANAVATGTTVWNSTRPTSTEFSLGTYADVNANGGTYVAYIYAHNAGGFGLTDTDNVISCGSYTGNGSANGPVINLGYEPQWVLIKNASSAGYDWYLLDNMRGVYVGSDDALLRANTSAAEVTAPRINFNATGFAPTSVDAEYNASGSTYIYIAIRRGPMKVPTSGTSVFAPVLTTTNNTITTNFPVDLSIFRTDRSTTAASLVFDRLRGQTQRLSTSATTAEATATAYPLFDSNTGTALTGFTAGLSGVDWAFRRAPSFFDEVCWKSDGTGNPVNHNLTIKPTLLIAKSRSNADNWDVAFFDSNTSTYRIGDSGSPFIVNSTTGWGTTTASGGYVTASDFTPLVFWDKNVSGRTYVAYLFATCAGVSKVGSYTGTGTTQQINCGFTGGARFILIKRTDSTGDWYVWDTARGIVSGNDPYVLWNSSVAEVTNTDYVDTYSAGFEISSTAPAAINASGGTFIFLAIA